MLLKWIYNNVFYIRNSTTKLNLVCFVYVSIQVIFTSNITDVST